MTSHNVTSIKSQLAVIIRINKKIKIIKLISHVFSYLNKYFV